MYQDIKQVVIQIILTGWTHITDVKEPETGYSFTGSLDFYTFICKYSKWQMFKWIKLLVFFFMQCGIIFFNSNIQDYKCSRTQNELFFLMQTWTEV